MNCFSQNRDLCECILMVKIIYDVKFLAPPMWLLLPWNLSVTLWQVTSPKWYMSGCVQSGDTLNHTGFAVCEHDVTHPGECHSLQNWPISGCKTLMMSWTKEKNLNDYSYFSIIIITLIMNKIHRWSCNYSQHACNHKFLECYYNHDYILLRDATVDVTIVK